MALPARSTDFAGWYAEVIRRAELADHTAVRGCIVVRPYGFALWELIRDALDARIKETGHENLYFPLFVPEGLLEREAAHVEGFAPQVAWVTHGGAEVLTERLAVRPTSEAIIGETYRRYIHSYRDLPVLVNQWANVVRWELRTKPFLRTAEFLWQEGHTFHATAAEAGAEARRMLDVYREIWEGWLAVPVVVGRKSEAEKFPGADVTLTGEALMGDRRSLQMGTSHDLGQHFARAFDITFLDRDNVRRHPYGTSWGFSWRTIGALIMVHGDDRGLVLPPRIAPVQVVTVPIWRSEAERAAVEPAVRRVEADLRARTLFDGQSIRVRVDWREEVTPGFKFNDWELKGVPLRLEVGPRDVAAGQVMLAERVPSGDTNEANTMADGGRRPVAGPRRETVPLGGVGDAVAGRLERAQRSLLEGARAFRAAHTWSIDTWEALVEMIGEEGGYVLARWCGSGACEQRVQAATGATLRVIPDNGELDGTHDAGPCVACAAPAVGRVVFARAY